MYGLERAIILAGDTRVLSYADGYRAIILTSGKVTPHISERETMEVPMDGELVITAIEDSFVTKMKYSGE